MDTESTNELAARYAATRDPAARDELIARHLGLVGRLARRFTSRGQDMDDLAQVGCVGLIKALDRYDANLGIPFAAFAIPTIVGEIQRYFRDRGDLVRIPRRLRELRAQRAVVEGRLAQEIGKMPAAADLAAAMPDSTLSDLEAAARIARPLSLDDDQADTSMGSAPQLAAFGREDEELARAEDRTAVRQVLMRLAPRERNLLYLRFYEGLSQAKTAKRLGVSQMHVSRWENRALRKMRMVLDT